MTKAISLTHLNPGQRGEVLELKDTGSMRRRLLDIGLAPNTPIECIGRSPLGDPSAFLIRGAVIAIRSEDCKKIILKSDEQGGVMELTNGSRTLNDD